MNEFEDDGPRPYPPLEAIQEARSATWEETRMEMLLQALRDLQATAWRLQGWIDAMDRRTG